MRITTFEIGRKTLTATMFLIVFTITLSAQTEKILYSFTGGNDGSAPISNLVFDSRGNLYGTTTFGGADFFGQGTIFELGLGSNGAWSEQILHAFVSSTDGCAPVGGVVFDSKGNLYGVTSGCGPLGFGTVFQLVPGSGGTWTENILYSFGTSDGGPESGLVLDSAGNLYGTTSSGGGAYGFGAVFEIVHGSSGTWTKRVLHNFTGGNDGSGPVYSPLTLDGAGNLYGMATGGGAHDYGVVFELTHGNWAEKVLYAFAAGSTGAIPAGGLALDAAGNVYGCSFYTAFELTPGSNGAWTQQTLHTFAGGSDGADCQGQLLLDKSGNLYGTTYTGGSHHGAVFELSPGSNGAWTEKILHRFSPSGGDGTYPLYGGLVLDGTGNLYGMTLSGGSSNQGAVFEVTP